ncbi:MAG: hypothetical protein LBD11_05205 [Candidatus Peribacteria bacterium]|jgi:hypothetical protein|nr:hypothetical protein [Candidatus Peribacteria bacterium]
MQVILVGKIATYKPELVLKENSPIDICIQHEAETSLGEILKLKSLDKKLLSKISNIAYFNNGVIKTKSENLQTYTSLPIPDRSLVDLNAYIDVRTILSSR